MNNVIAQAIVELDAQKAERIAQWQKAVAKQQAFDAPVIEFCSRFVWATQLDGDSEMYNDYRRGMEYGNFHIWGFENPEESYIYMRISREEADMITQMWGGKDHYFAGGFEIEVTPETCCMNWEFSMEEPKGTPSSYVEIRVWDLR